MPEVNPGLLLRAAHLDDLPSLLVIEQQCFTSDRLSRRSFRHHLQSEHSILIVAEKPSADNNSVILGYGLCLLNRGTRLARLYSLAVLPAARGLAVGRKLLEKIEQLAQSEGRLFMRLEVAKNNHSAISLYEASGYRVFGEYVGYYEDHIDAARMQKTICQAPWRVQGREAVWYQQTTEFTCGPAALMMAMSSLDSQVRCDQSLELDLWRESTTIFMTSGLGGTHPFGLAAAAKKRGFEAEVVVNTVHPLFVDGVRIESKKEIIRMVHQQFLQQCHEDVIDIHYRDVTQAQVEQWLAEGYAVVILISTYRLYGKKAPHWVMVTGIDNNCLYVHDPDVDDNELPLDCQHVPIARKDFDRMSTFGASRLRCAIAIRST